MAGVNLPVAGTTAPSEWLDTSVPHPARRYNYWLGGKDNFAADRESGDAIAAVFPGVRTAAVENRRFLHRTVRYLAGAAGVRQFLDIGVGIPVSPNTHEIAQGIVPGCRVVYADNDPIVLTHARALLTSGPQGATAYLEADLRDPVAILDHPELHHTLDLSEPVALLLVAVLHFLDDDAAARVVAELVGELAPGSYVVLSHGTADFWPGDVAAQIPGLHRDGETRFYPRTRQQVAGFVAGLHVVEPGVSAADVADPVVPVDPAGSQLVSVARWRPDRRGHVVPPDKDIACYGVVAAVPTHPAAPPGPSTVIRPEDG